MQSKPVAGVIDIAERESYLTVNTGMTMRGGKSFDMLQRLAWSLHNQGIQAVPRRRPRGSGGKYPLGSAAKRVQDKTLGE